MRNCQQTNTTSGPKELTPCDKLKLAEARLVALMTGQAVTVVETPQLGRVEFATAGLSLVDLQRLISGLQTECARYQGTTNPHARKPISVEVNP